MTLPEQNVPSGGGPGGSKFSAEDEALLTAVASRVVRMGMATPAVFFLESVKPLSFIGSQALIFFEPFVRAFFHLVQYEQFARLMEDRHALEHLLQRIEALDEEMRDRERVEKEAQKVAKRAEKEAKKEAKRAAEEARRRGENR
jgi:hypothetical protein